MQARQAKERAYSSLRRSAKCKLVVLAVELRGWSHEAASFVRLLACSRARAVPAVIRGPSISAFASRWSALLSFAAACFFAPNLLSLPLAGTANLDGDVPADAALELPLAPAT